MIITAIVLWLLLLAIAATMWWRMRKASFADWIERDAHEHHVVQRMISQHPTGGEHSQVVRWITIAKNDSQG